MLKRPSNKPRADIVGLAAAAVAAHGGSTLARAWFKFDCAACGSREVAPEPNVLPDRTRCTVCGQETVIVGGGFALQLRRDATIDWDSFDHDVAVVRPRYANDRGDA